MRARILRHAVLVAGVTGLAAASIMCAPPTEIVVDVYTEVECTKGPTTTFKTGVSLDELRTKAASSELVACAPRTERSGRIVLSPSAAKDETVAFQVTTRNDALDPEQTCTEQSYAGCIVARRQVRFSRGTSTRVEVALRLSCLDKPCLPTESCRNGTCASAVLPESCLGAECTDPGVDPPPPPVPDAAPVPTEAGLPETDGGLLAVGEVSPTPAYVVPGGEIRGLAAYEAGLVWLELPFDPRPRVVRALWRNLSANTFSYTVGDGFGVTADAAGNAIVAGQFAQSPGGTCAHVEGAGDVACATKAYAVYGVARGASPNRTYVGGIGPTGQDGSIAWFASSGPALVDYCSTDSGTGIRYLEVQGTTLFFAAGEGVRKMELTNLGAACGDTLLLPLKEAVGVATTPEGDVCAGSAAGIRCLTGGGTMPVEPRPTGDLAFRRVGASLFLYYVAGDAIRVMRIK